MSAALDGQTEIVKGLLRNGAHVNAQNLEGRTALMFAVINLRTDTVKTLLQFGADVNVQAHCGCTPLTLAACSGDIGITQALLNNGADANKVCSPGKTALIVAIEHGYHALGELLKRAMGQSKHVKPERLPSDLRGRERSVVLSTTT
jgi:ankyrin repeat protein